MYTEQFYCVGFTSKYLLGLIFVVGVKLDYLLTSHLGCLVPVANNPDGKLELTLRQNK